MKSASGTVVERLAVKVGAARENINDYEEFLSSWQGFAAGQLDESHGAGNDFSQIEQFAANSLSQLVEKSPASLSGYVTSPLFNSLNNSAVICDIGGKVSAANDRAVQHYGLMPEMLLDSMSLKLTRGDTISSELRELLVQSQETSQLSLLQCYFQNAEPAIPMVIMRLEGNNHHLAQALVIFLDPACNAESMGLIAKKFDLTVAETNVLSAFTAGKTLKDIAKTRQRSYTTIRNQFQSILEKTGCPNQADLLRMLLGISYLFTYTTVLSGDETRELGKKIEIMRPHGRFVEVMLYGDLAGQPFISLHSLFGMSVTPAIEAELQARSMLMIGVWRPGFGGTTRPYSDEDQYQCLAEDITTVLDNMGIGSCLFLGRASSALSLFKLCRLMPTRISDAVVLNSLVPGKYIVRNTIISKWTAALVSSSTLTPTFATLILGMGRKLMLRNGAEQFCKKMYKSSAIDQKTVSDRDVAMSIYRGTLHSGIQGMEFPALDMLEGFKDWSDDVVNQGFKVKLMQGFSDPNVSIEASRDFAADFPDQVELIEVPDGGGILSYTHVGEVLDVIKCRIACSR